MKAALHWREEHPLNLIQLSSTHAYTRLFEKLIERHKIQYLFYAGDTQLYFVVRAV